MTELFLRWAAEGFKEPTKMLYDVAWLLKLEDLKRTVGWGIPSVYP